MIPDINLLPQVRRNESSSRVIFSIIAIVGVIVFVVLIWQYMQFNQSIADLDNKHQLLQAHRDQLLDESLTLASEDTGSFTEALTFIERVSYPVTPLMDEVTSLLLPHSYLREYTFGENTVTIVMDFETITDVAAYTARLIPSQYFNDVQVNTMEAFEIFPLPVEDVAASKPVNSDRLPRYKVNLKLLINEQYLAAGGVGNAQ